MEIKGKNERNSRPQEKTERGRERKNTRRKDELMKRVSPEQYRRNRLARLGEGTSTAAIIIGAVLVIVLIVFGITKGVSAVRTLIADRQERAAQLAREKAMEVEERDITIASTGCMLLHGQVLEAGLKEDGTYDFSEIYRYITPYYSAFDYMTCEFEGTLTGGDYSGYPVFHSPDAIIEAIRDSGVDLQFQATNHVYDALSEAFHRTMEVYEEKGIAYTGIRPDTAAKPYYIADVQDVKIGYIDYVYETSGTGVDLNEIAVAKKDEDLINTFDVDYLDDFYKEFEANIAAMHEDGARFIVTVMHWGEEYHLVEADYQDQIAQKLCDLGVDAVIGGHPHCEQPIDVLESTDGTHNMFCIYSVGNALSNQRAELISEMPDGHTEDGVIVVLTLHRDIKNNVAITGVNLLPTWVYRKDTEDGELFYILPLNDVENIEKTTGFKGIKADAKASYERTMEELGEGLERARAVFGASEETSEEF